MSVIIRMKNLPVSAAASDVRAFFAGLKIPDGAVHIIGGDEGEVFVGFASDEDARIAMTRDKSKIHGEEIRLLLSSKTEQSSMIAARKHAPYSSPEPVYDEYAYHTQVPADPPMSQQNWKPQPAENPYAAKSGYEASYPPQNSKANHPDFNHPNSFSRRPPMGQHPQQQSIEKPKDPFGGDYGGYKHSFQPQRQHFSPTSETHPPSNRFRSDPPPSLKPPEPVKQNVDPPAHPPQYQNQKPASEPQYGIRGVNNSNGARENSFHGSGNGRVANGDSWRDNSFRQPNRNEYHDDRRDYQEDYKPDFKNNFQGGNKFNQVPVRNDPPMNPHQPDVRPTQPLNARKTLIPTPPAPFQSAPQPFATLPSGGNNPQVNRPFPTAAPQSHIQNRNGQPGFQNGPVPPIPIQNNMSRQMPPANLPSTPPFQNAMPAPPPTKVPAFNQPPTIPLVNKPIVPAAQPNAEKFYVELTRLPVELLRPAALEAFIRPTAPLTLSSVKTVFGPGGIHMHTIIRLDSIADYATMMRRNGEQGIKIQQSDKKTFDTAIDGAPLPMVIPPVPIVAPLVPPVNVNVSRDDEENRRLKRSRWESSPENSKRSPPRRSPPRRDLRDRSRSNSPPRRGMRFRSPTRREQREHTDPTRWCMQVTNVPFRMKEDELMEWFSEKVRPAKLVRTFYADGNASDRWIAEFSSETLMRRTFSIKAPCSGRFLLLRYIPNDRADELMKIEDHYGEEKKNKNEEARAQQEANFSHPPSFFNAPAPAMRGPPAMAQGPGGPMMSPVMPQGPGGPPNGMNGAAPSAAGFIGQPTVRGGFVPRGQGGFQPAPRGGIVGKGGHNSFQQNGGNNYNNQPDAHPKGSFGNNFNSPPDSHPQGSFGNQGPDAFRGGFRGAFRGGRGRGGGYQGNHRNEETLPTHNEFMELVNSLGPRGTVLSCTGFPRDVTLEDVVGFFGAYEPDRNSIRIRRGDDGVMTGECMLACFGPENARRASVDLNGHAVRNSNISIKLV